MFPFVSLASDGWAARRRSIMIMARNWSNQGLWPVLGDICRKLATIMRMARPRGIEGVAAGMAVNE
jgi:hypothetical protein